MMRLVLGWTAFALGAFLLAQASAAHAVSTPEDRDVHISAPDAGSTSTDARPTFVGTGTPGAALVVRDLRGTVLCATTVTGHGWSCSSIRPMGDGLTAAVATQNVAGHISRDSVTFRVMKEEPSRWTLWTAPIASGVALILLITAILVVNHSRVVRRRGRRAVWRR
jgi:hypothetical protein